MRYGALHILIVIALFAKGLANESSLLRFNISQEKLIVSETLIATNSFSKEFSIFFQIAGGILSTYFGE